MCKSALPIPDSATIDLRCAACAAAFTRGEHSFDFTPPPAFRETSPIWQAWDRVQANGLTGYTADPDRNLSIGHRSDCEAFRTFCACRGLVLDVGCGPQAWPAYFVRSDAATYVGIDPFADLGPAEFLKFTGLGEFLPFSTDTFDHVLFATSLDHFVDPASPLGEAVRVLKRDGEIDVWLGEKDAAAPKMAHSMPWYERLEQPELAEDVFHIRRMSDAEFRSLAAALDLVVLDHERCQVDRYRTNHFYRLRPDA